MAMIELCDTGATLPIGSAYAAEDFTLIVDEACTVRKFGSFEYVAFTS